MYDKIVKSERILTKLRVPDYEYCGQQSTELITQLTNSLGTSKYILKTYNAPQITLTQKAHYQHIPQFPTR